MIDLTEPEKVNLMSMNITEEQKSKLKQIFPYVFNEDKIDFDKLRLTLGEAVDEGRERYGMTWAGKSECFKIIQQPSIGTLKASKEESVNFDDSENLFIEGDNLEVLKILQKSYYGKVKMIYIDPPYNTGKEFIYPDKYAETLDTYLAYTGQVNDEGIKFSTNTESDGRFHSKWLNMMYVRLFLARNLLQDDGVIWISIDDIEVGNVRQMLNEIFGEENFVATFIWEKRKTRENRRVFSFNHDYIVCYAKEKNAFQLSRNLLPLTEEARSRYKNPDNDPRGDWQSVALTAQAGHGTSAQFYTIITPSGRKVDPPSGNCWRVTEHRLKEMIEEKRIWFGEDGNNVPRQKVFINEQDEGLTPHTLWTADEVGTTDSAKRSLNLLFNGVTIFDTPKPVELLTRMCQISMGPEDIALDFFAGSASLSEAILRLNYSDKGKRRYIVVQLPEPCDEASEAYKAGCKTIADIGKERIRRLISKIEDEHKQSSSQTTFSDSDSKDNIKQLDLCFKVFNSSFKDRVKTITTDVTITNLMEKWSY